MLKNLIKTALRNIRSNKAMTIINVLGLALGMTICLLITLYVIDELSYDTYNAKAGRIYRVNTDIRSGTSVSSRAIASPAVAIALQHAYPEVEKTVRLLPGSERFKKGDVLVQEDKVAYCDSSIFDVFTFSFMDGRPEMALQEPHSIVITESAAHKYFNTTDVVGKTLTKVDENNVGSIYKVTAVIHDIPPQSHFHFDFFMSLSPVEVSHKTSFGALFPFSTYILLKPGTDYKKLESKFPDLVRKNFPFLASMEKTGGYFRINLTPLKEIHLNSNRTNELEVNGNIQYVRIFSMAAIFILLIACINFMNLATARSANRAREVGVRKVLGSSRRLLIMQFLSESMLQTFIATFLAIVASVLLLPLFNQMSGKHLILSAQNIAGLFLLLILISITVGLLAGSYPAFFLSSFKPVSILSGKLATGFRGGHLRNLLVIFQFSISVFLIISTLVIYSQLRYIQHKNLGFQRDHTLVIKNMNAIGNEANTFKVQVKQLPGVVNASLSSFLPTGDRRWLNYLGYGSTFLETQFWPVDEDYLPTLGMNLTKGRGFSSSLATDSSAIIINEAAAAQMGYSDAPLNKKIFYGQNEKEYHIIGVVKDFNFSSLRNNISPVVMTMTTQFERNKEGDGPDNLCIRINTTDISGFLSKVRSEWNTFASGQTFQYSFMNEDFDAIYHSEQRMGNLFIVFTTLATIIACLGLFALSAFASEQRKKEISIRKVLGADTPALLAMLTRNFLKLVLIAIIISSPLSWWIMSGWLQDFAYRQPIHWWLFVVAGLTAMLIAFLTIGFHSLKAIRLNPVNNLRTE